MVRLEGCGIKSIRRNGTFGGLWNQKYKKKWYVWRAVESKVKEEMVRLEGCGIKSIRLIFKTKVSVHHFQANKSVVKNFLVKN